MQYFLVVKECIFVLMEILKINVEKDDFINLDTRESLYLKLINSENTTPVRQRLKNYSAIRNIRPEL